MNKEDIIKLGASAELAEKINTAIQDEYVKSGNYIPKAKFDEVNQEKSNLKSQLDAANAGLKTLKEGAEGNDALKQTIQKLQDEQKEANKRHKDEMDELRKRNAILGELGGMAHDPEIVLKLVDLSKVSVGDDGKVTGWAEQRDGLIKDKPFLFKSGTKVGDPFNNGAGDNPNLKNPAPTPNGAFNPEEFAKSLATGSGSKDNPITPDYYFKR